MKKTNLTKMLANLGMFQRLEQVELLPGVAKKENFGFTRLDKGAITASWNGEADANNELYGVEIRAKETGSISERLKQKRYAFRRRALVYTLYCYKNGDEENDRRRVRIS